MCEAIIVKFCCLTHIIAGLINTLMKKLILAILLPLAISACTGMGGDTSKFPKSAEDARLERRGKVTGENGLKLFGGGDDKDDKGGNGIGVNSFLWRATIDTISFMPIAQADPFGGVITTDWYEDPDAKGERLKINALILDDRLRADGIRVSVFKQKADEKGEWRDVTVDKDVSRKIEDKILARAREMRIAQTGK
jgi:hypothetical protein